ncbi:MAG: hypothetical protein RLZZ69_1651, partial [Cyanobacteriota bacterium]
MSPKGYALKDSLSVTKRYGLPLARKLAS